MTTSAPAALLPALVIVHGVDLTTSALERRLTAVVATLPPDVDVIATTARAHRSTTAVGGRVRLQPVSDQGHGLVDRGVRSGRFVITVPPSVDLSLGWFETAATMARQSREIGVLVCGREGVFVFPPGILSVDAPRAAWTAIPGVTTAAVDKPGASRLSLSAVLIVKDEEEDLPACLAALDGVVDEVVVYDTGSSDNTVEIARASGAKVVEGYWDADFGRARNRALEHATGDWALSIDADEVLDCIRAELRSVLDTTTSTAFTVRQVSTSWAGADSGFEVLALRLFRRTGARWHGAIHEALVPLNDDAWALSTTPAPLRLMHSGYRSTSTEGKDKGARNTSIALASRDAATEGSVEWVTVQAHLSRSLALAGRFEEARTEFDRLFLHDVPAVVFVPAARVAIHLLLEDEASYEAAGPWIDRAEALGESAGQVALWRARLALAEGDAWGASDLLAEYDSLTSDGGVDIWGQAFDVTEAMTTLAAVDLVLGLPREALRRMKEVLHAAPDRVAVRTLLETVHAAGFTLRDLVREAPQAFLERSLRDVPQVAPAAALAWFTAMADERPGDHRPVVAAAVVASRTGVIAALEWSVRAREGGFVGVCALRMLAENADLPAQARLLAWAVLLHGFGELDAAAGVLELSDQVDEAGRAQALSDLQLVAPEAEGLFMTPPLVR